MDRRAVLAGLSDAQRVAARTAGALRAVAAAAPIGLMVAMLIPFHRSSAAG